MDGRRWFFRPVGHQRHAQRDEQINRGAGREQQEVKEVNWHKIIWEEYFPAAFAIGISESEFRKLTPAKLEQCIEGFKLRQKMQNEQIWSYIGAYLIPGVSIAVRQGAWGKKEIEYPNKPYGADDQGNAIDSEEELQRRREEFVLNMKIRKANWDLAHPKKEEGDSE